MNHNYFNKINTQKKAYFLGLLMADGNVYINPSIYRHALELTLLKTDSYLIRELRKCLKCKTKIMSKKNTKCNKWYVNSKVLTSDLINWGIVPRKSFVTKTPNIPKKLLKHFYRGLIDGDGAIYSYKNRWIFSICGSKKIIQEIKEYIQPSLNREYDVQKHKSGIYYYIVTGLKNIVAIYDRLYKNASIYMKRKYNNFKKCLALSKTDVAKSGFIGVSFRNKKYKAYLSVNSQYKSLGYFLTAKKAAQARDLFLIKNDINYQLNFPKENYVGC